MEIVFEESENDLHLVVSCFLIGDSNSHGFVSLLACFEILML